MLAFVDGTLVQGFLLLTIPNCVLSVSKGPTGPQTGTLALQCVTLDVPSGSMPDRDVWLVLKLAAFEMAISPTQTINYSRSTHTYMFLPESESAGFVQLEVPPDPANPASLQDLETMEVVLSQYGVLHDMEGPLLEKGQGAAEFSDTKPGPVDGSGTSELKGRLVLMDEDDGEVVATLDEAVQIKEDKSLAAVGHAKHPVVVDLPGDEVERAGRAQAYVHSASPEEQNMLMATAGLISRGIILATSAITTGMTSASNYYISRSTPTNTPVEFSPRTRANMKRIHKVSGTAVTITSKTTGAILSTLDHVANKLAGPSAQGHGKGVAYQGAGYAQAQATAYPLTTAYPPAAGYPQGPGYHEGPRHPQLSPPPLPPRSGSPGSSSPRAPYGGMPPRKPRLLNRLLACTDLLLTTLEHSANELIEAGTGAVSASLAHRYGQDVGDASRVAGNSARNVGLVYIDARGVGRRALLRRAGKAVVKARMGERVVILGPEAQAMRDVDPSQSPGCAPAVGTQITTSLPAYTPRSTGSAPAAGGVKK